MTILGYSLSSYLSENKHIENITRKAKTNLLRLYRFKSAPPNIKKHLYLSLIRPILEYPNLELYKSSKTSLSKLQKIQNKALRFISNVSLKDRKTSKSLHIKHKIDPINIRLSKLACKTLYKIKHQYFSNTNDNNFEPPYSKLSPKYNLSQTPIKNKSQSVFQYIDNHIFNSCNNRKLTILNLPDDMDDFAIPQPCYK